MTNALPSARRSALRVACVACGDLVPASELTTALRRCALCKGIHVDPDAQPVSPVSDWEDDEEAQRLVEEHPDGMTLSEIGDALGITRERVRQIQEHALEKLARRCADFGIEPADLAAALAAKPVTEDYPEGFSFVGGSRRRDVVIEPCDESARVAAALDALEVSTRRLRAWCDALDELKRIEGRR